MRILKTSVFNILNLIACASDYGFDDEILFSAFADLLSHNLPFEEIEEYTKQCCKEEELSEEDFFTIKDRLEDFRNRYIRQQI